MTARFLGLDLGTSSVKGLLVGDDGAVLGRHGSAYPTANPRPGHAEQDLADWTAAVAEVVAHLVPDGRVDGVGIAGHTPSLVAVGADRRAVRPCLTWQDVRAVAEADELEASLGDEIPLVGGRLPWNPAYLPAKLVWLARSGLDGTRWLFQPKDAVDFALTGVAATDPWGSKGLNRVDDTRVVTEVFALAGADPELLPPRRPAWDRLGGVDAEGAAWSGLQQGVPVAVGWTDALAGMLGVGAFAGPRAFVLTGTSDIAGTTFELDPPDTLLHVPAACAPRPVTYGPTQTSGAAVLWLADVLGTTAAEVVALAGRADPDDPTVFVPYLAGERAPVWRPDVRAVFDGMSTTTRAPELAQAVLRGVAASDRHVLAEAGHRDEPVHVGGASARATPWIAARTRVWGADLALHAEPDTGALGAAVLAATAAGADLATVSVAMAGTVDVHPAAGHGDRGAHVTRYRRAVAHALDRPA